MVTENILDARNILVSILVRIKHRKSYLKSKKQERYCNKELLREPAWNKLTKCQRVTERKTELAGNHRVT